MYKHSGEKRAGKFYVQKCYFGVTAISVPLFIWVSVLWKAARKEEKKK